jgi:hypothetical protein
MEILLLLYGVELWKVITDFPVLGHRHAEHQELHTTLILVVLLKLQNMKHLMQRYAKCCVIGLLKGQT